MIDIRKLKELVRLMVANELTELDLRDSEEQVTLRRPGVTQERVITVPVADPSPAAVANPVALAPQKASAPAEPVAEGTEVEAGLVTITSPMVGTFFAASSPDASPFVHEGSSVRPESVVCIIEAMKIFNEIKAECTGTIVEVLADNGEPVEFGQALFLVRPV